MLNRLLLSLILVLACFLISCSSNHETAQDNSHAKQGRNPQNSPGAEKLTGLPQPAQKLGRAADAGLPFEFVRSRGGS